MPASLTKPSPVPEALETDPSSFIAQQELRRTQQMMNEAANPNRRPWS